MILKANVDVRLYRMQLKAALDIAIALEPTVL